MGFSNFILSSALSSNGRLPHLLMSSSTVPSVADGTPLQQEQLISVLLDHCSMMKDKQRELRKNSEKEVSFYQTELKKRDEVIVSLTEQRDEAEKKVSFLTKQLAQRNEKTLNSQNKDVEKEYRDREQALRERIRCLEEQKVQANKEMDSPHNALHIDAPSGKMVVFARLSCDTIADIKKKIGARLGCAVEEQSLYFDGKKIDGDHVLCYYGIENGSSLQLRLHLDSSTV